MTRPIVLVWLPPTAATAVPAVVRAGGEPWIDLVAHPGQDVPPGAWVRVRPDQSAVPGTGPVVRAGGGAPIAGRDTWLEATDPGPVPKGFAGLILKGREAGGRHGTHDGLVLLARCPEPGRVLLHAGLGPRTAAAAVALGARGIVVADTHLGLPELDLPPDRAARLALPDDEVTCSVAGWRLAVAPTSGAVAAALSGAEPTAWQAGQGLALARDLAREHRSLDGLIRAYHREMAAWKDRVGEAVAARGPGVTATTTAALAAPLAVADATAGSVGSGVLWEQAARLGRAVRGEPLLAAMALGVPVDAPAASLRATAGKWLGPEPEPVPTLIPEGSSPAVAIVGLGARLPGAANVTAFWNNVIDGVSAIGPVPTDRWDPDLYWDPDPNAPDKTYARIGAFVRDFSFDTRRFRIPPRVARQVDVVQQWTLASVADALEDANLQVDAKGDGRPFDRSRCAVILGNSLGGEVKDRYALRLSWPEVAERLKARPPLSKASPAEQARLLADLESAYKAGLPEVDEDSMPGELSNVIAGRIANAFDLGGPNFTVDAACASSMAAIQAAVKGLQDGDFDLAITGGADRSMNLPTYVKFCKIGALSPDHSAPFDASANGFVMGEGCGILVLKRLDDAVRDNDRIYALVRGVGASSDGKGKGITAPNIQGQILALKRAYEIAGVDPGDVDLIEAHGTSTVVGDKVEVEALGEVITTRSPARGPIRLGSVKSMIGHLKSAAGAASLIKAALALHHGVLPPSLGYRAVRDDVPLDRVPLRVQTRAEPWPPTPSGVRRAGVSAFGFGGTNFHVVLESWAGQELTTPQRTAGLAGAAPPPRPTLAPPEAPMAARATPPPPPRSTPLPPDVWATSADDLPALIGNLRRLAAGEPAPFDPSAPLRIAAASAPAERAEQLDRAIKNLEKGANPDLLRARAIWYEDAPVDGDLAMLFTGQGSQYVGMGLDLAERYAIVRDTFAEADVVLRDQLGLTITQLLTPGPNEEALEARLRQTEFSQPATLALDVALLRLLAAYGVHPDMVAGHSLGEYAAAVAAGVLDFRQALQAVGARGKEMAGIRLDDPGKMAGVATTAELVDEVLAEIDGYVIAANKNCPTQTVIAGASDAVDDAMERFRARGITVHPLPVSHAFHSAIVAPATEPLRKVLTRLAPRAPRRPITTNVTAEWYPESPAAIVDLLAQQVSAPVEWTAQLERMYDEGARVFLECGPKRALTGFTVSVLKRRPHRALYTNHPKRGGVLSFHDALAALIAAGFPVLPAPLAAVDVLAAPGARRATTEAVRARLALRRDDNEAIPDVTDAIRRIVADASGYAEADLDPDFELEADLGIDTVKQAEVFGVVRDTYGIPPDPTFSFAAHKTIRALTDWAAARIGATRPTLPAAAAAALPAAAAPGAPQTPPAPAAAPTADPELVSRFLRDAAGASLAGLDAERFAAALLPSLSALVAAAFDAARAAQPPAPAPVAAVVPAPDATPPPAPIRSAPRRPPEPHPDTLRVVCSGASIGLPGGPEVFDPDNVARILAGENRIENLGDASKQFLDLRLVRLVKDPRTGEGSFLPVNDVAQVIQLAGRAARHDLTEWGVPRELVEALDTTSQLAIAAGYEALRDAGIPLVQAYRETKSGGRVATGWVLPEALRDRTGVVFASAFPGLDRLVEKLESRGDDGSGRFDRRFLFQILSMGHSQFAQLIGARGPNTQVNAACASTTQGIAIAEDWIRAGRCDRVIVVGADDVTSDRLLKWIGGGFMASGAATTEADVTKAALPFDRRRHGMILGMGAVGLVLERDADCRGRGVDPVGELLATAIVNSAFHGTRLDTDHIAKVMTDVVERAASQEGVSPARIASSALFMSHETYTPARGGSAQAEIDALRAAFGADARHVVVTNTKGFTGHAMGAGIEDAVALKAMQLGRIPPVANLAEPDPELGDLTLSRGEDRRVEYAVRLAAGFGSQIAIAVWKARARGEARTVDPTARRRWLQDVTGFAHVSEQVEQRTLRAVPAEADRLVDPGAASPVPAPARVAVPRAPAAGDPGLLGELLALIAEKTGYGVEELEPDFELEADLGIDTVKQAEILGDLREKYTIPLDDAFRLSDYRTIAALGGWLARARGGRTEPVWAVEPPQGEYTIAPDAEMLSIPPEGELDHSNLLGTVRTDLLELIADKTGYGVDELEPDFELEADLGIDTVKQAEVFGELRNRYAIGADDGFRLAEHPTIDALARYVADAVVRAAAESVEPDALVDSEIDTPITSPRLSEAPTPLRPPPRSALRPPPPGTVPPRGAARPMPREPVGVRDTEPHASEAPTPIHPGRRSLVRPSSVAPTPVPLTPTPVASLRPAGTSRPPEPSWGGPSDVPSSLGELISIVAEHTGYEPSDLDPEQELEADLGVDTVKQAEIVSELRERWSLPPDDGFRLADHPTIRSIASWVDEARATAPASAVESRTAPREQVDLILATEPPEPVEAEVDNTEPPGDGLPASFRLRRPVLVERASRLPPGPPAQLDGHRVRIVGTGPVADALRTQVERRGATVAEPATAVFDVGNHVRLTLTAARALAGAPPAHWITLTRLGDLAGVFPLDRAFSDGARAGFTKALGREWPSTAAVVVDVDPADDDATTAGILCDELLGAAEPEVFRRGLDRRGVAYRVEAIPTHCPQPSEPVVLLTGGARGVTARLAAELAHRGTVRLALVGRTALPEQPYDLDREKSRAREAIEAAGERATPAAVDARLAPLRRANEALTTLTALRALGATVIYEAVDLADPSAVPELIERVEAQLGPIDAVIHGAGVEESRPLANKDDAAFDRVFAGKALGGEALVRALPHQTRLLSMGSVAGRYGNAGQVDYAAANDALARLCLTRQNALHVDWTAWDDVGMAVRGGMRRLMEERGVVLLPAGPGSKLAIDLLWSGLTGELVAAGLLGGMLPPPSHPLLDSLEHDGDCVRARRTLTLESDPWLADHAIDGKPVLPGVIGLELMAAVAAEAAPGLPPTGARDVRFHRAVKLHRDAPTTVIVEAWPVDDFEVRCVVVSERALATGRTQRTMHFEATLMLGELGLDNNLPSAFLPDEPLGPAAIYRRFFHGPVFRVLTGVQGISADGLLASAVADSGAIALPLLTEPLIVEAALQAAGMHRLITHHRMVLPAAIEEVHLLSAPAPGETVQIMVRADGDRYDVDIDGEAGPILRMRGFALVDLDPLPPDLRIPEPEGGRPRCFPDFVRGTPPRRGDGISAHTGDGAVAWAAWGDDPTPWLTDAEIAEHGARGTDRRRADVIAGRIAAKRAVARLTGVDPRSFRVVRAPSGEPLLEPDLGARVSISHRAGRAVALAVRDGRPGIDLEHVEPRPASFRDEWYRPRERALAADPWTTTVMWAVKEAILKALGTGMALSPRDVEITALDGASATVVLHGQAAARLAEVGATGIQVTWSAQEGDLVLVSALLAA